MRKSIRRASLFFFCELQFFYGLKFFLGRGLFFDYCTTYVKNTAFSRCLSKMILRFFADVDCNIQENVIYLY